MRFYSRCPEADGLSDLADIRENLPEALRHHLPEEMEVPDYPMISVSEMASVIESLSLGQGYPRYAVLMFLPHDATDEDYVNLQYSVDHGIVGMDWVLLGARNIADSKAIRALAKTLGFSFRRYEMNQVSYLRVEGPGLAELAHLGTSIVSGFYQFEADSKVKLLLQGFNWKRAPSQVSSLGW